MGYDYTKSIHYKLGYTEAAIERKKNTNQNLSIVSIVGMSCLLCFGFTISNNNPILGASLIFLFIGMILIGFSIHNYFNNLKELRSLEKDLIKINKQLLIKEIIE